MIRTLAALLVVLALVIGIVPLRTDCQSQGHAITLANGKTIPMKCHWTAMAEVAMAAPLLVVGLLLALSKRRESRRALAAVAAIQGLLVVLLPTALVGVCPNPEMLCSSVMKPTLILGGLLVVAIGAAGLLAPGRELEPAA